MPTTAYHSFKASGNIFEIPTRYSLIRPIGHGAYGVVISALDKETGNKVAIKKVTRAFEDPVDAKRILREIKLMKKFSHENVIRIIDIIPPAPSVEEFEDIYIVQDLMETDLHRIIYSRQTLTIDHIQYFVYQLLRGLKYIHSANVLHRDLKPSNLLLNSNCDLKICDFGLSRGVEDEQKGELTEYVVTRWYRAPEIMLACQEYTKAIDIWSVGCIFAELLARSPLFPGEDYIAQLRLICDKLGRPSDNDLEFVTSDRAKRFMLSLPLNKPIEHSVLFPNYKDESEALDLLMKMLAFDPATRLTIEEALEHPFLTSLHNEEDEPISDFQFHFEFEHEDLSRERVQELIWKEIKDLHPEVPDNHPTNGSVARSSAKLTSNNSNNDSKNDVKNDVKSDSKDHQVEEYKIDLTNAERRTPMARNNNSNDDAKGVNRKRGIERNEK
eukprot:TRINITY_DN7367_c0_g1_i1.p1 TRINITY_DN7367_c0_g1~~TRINITY_DN7367_c0_g1_i1.p1  ORF type:complete len:442 (+),score=-20.31 TRINITY_DN7367_c0_g1_i1:61-1386(+)